MDPSFWGNLPAWIADATAIATVVPTQTASKKELKGQP